MTRLVSLTLEDYTACLGRLPDPWVNADELCAGGWAMYRGDDLLGCGGILPYWPGVAEAWMCLGPDIKIDRDLLAGMHEIKRKLSEAGYRRIQADTAPVHGRFMRLLGFKFESEMPGYFPDGSTSHRYVRLKD